MLRGHRSRRMHRYTENDVKPDSNDDPRLVSSNAVLHPHFASSVEAFTLGVMWLKQCHKLHIGIGKHTTYQNGDDWGMGYEPHYPRT